MVMQKLLRNYLLKLVEDSSVQNQQNILTFIDPSPDQIGIDLGCDDGLWTKEIADKSNASRMYGIDIVADRVAEAKKEV